MQFPVCQVLSDGKPQGAVIETVWLERDNPVVIQRYPRLWNSVMPLVSEADGPVLLDGSHKVRHALLMEVVVEDDATAELRRLPECIVEHERINQRALDASVSIEFLDSVGVVTPIAGDLYVELIGNNPAVLLKRAPGIILPVFIKSGAVPLAIDFLVSDSFWTCASDSINEPYISSEL